ncbi:MAG: universal stress protein [Methanomassiliicoccus sp.]|nr:universal stress protein [Methanomassiliicoccus sp.]
MEERLVPDGLVGGKNLLLATDGKPHSVKAIEYAMEMAKLTSSKLFIIYVVSPKNESERSEIIKEGMGTLQELKAMGSDRGLDVTTLMEGGSPHQSIVSTAERIKAGAIIVGTSGKTVLDRVLIGSVSEYVVRNSGCTVIVVK